LSGSLAIGAVFELTQTRSIGVSALPRLFLMTGVLGGYTTFSTFSLDAVMLAGEGASLTAILYAAASVAGGFIAAFAGILIVRIL
jgi:CrcB protein